MQSTLRMAVPLWLGRASERNRRRYPSLKGPVDVDAAIIGGGIVGATVAETFSRAGVRVAVVEAELAGHGSTAASSALLMQEPDDHLGALAKTGNAQLDPYRACLGLLWSAHEHGARIFECSQGRRIDTTPRA